MVKCKMSEVKIPKSQEKTVIEYLKKKLEVAEESIITNINLNGKSARVVLCLEGTGHGSISRTGPVELPNWVDDEMVSFKDIVKKLLHLMLFNKS